MHSMHISNTDHNHLICQLEFCILSDTLRYFNLECPRRVSHAQTPDNTLYILCTYINACAHTLQLAMGKVERLYSICKHTHVVRSHILYDITYNADICCLLDIEISWQFLNFFSSEMRSSALYANRGCSRWLLFNANFLTMNIICIHT